jgi:hypothetical protein
MEALAGDLRTHIFGLHLTLKYVQIADGQEKIVDLPSSSGM